MARTGAVLIWALLAGGCASSGGGGGPEAARALVEEARHAAASGDYERAAGLCTKAIGADPECAEAYFVRGSCCARLRLRNSSGGDVRRLEDRALADFGAAIRLDPAYGDAYFNRAMVLCSRAQYKPAAEDLLGAIRYKPQDPEPHLWLARIYEEKFEDRRQAANEHYEKYADLGGRDPEAREKARRSREAKKLAAAAAAPSRAPTAEDEKKAEGLHEDFKRSFADGNTDAALKAVEELVTQYGHTQYVQRQARQLAVLLDYLRSKTAPRNEARPKDAPKGP